MFEQMQILLLPFLACLVLTGIHVYLGIHVISRKVIFVDIALAQIAALGATIAFLLGHHPRSGGAYGISLGFAVLAAAIFALTRTRQERVPQEAVIGLTYATAWAAAILIADIAPRGSEHLNDLLAGSIVWVTPDQILKIGLLYGAIGLFHYLFRDRFLLISLEPEKAYAQGIRVRFWDFLFYLSFGVVITSSVQIAGVLLVFCYLVAPAVFAVMFFNGLKQRLLTGWAMAAVVSAVGLLFSYDRPSGPTIMVCFAATLFLGGAARGIVHSHNRSRNLAVTAIGFLLATGMGWGLYHFRPDHPGHPASESGPGPSLAGSPEHPVGQETEDLRAAVRDPHPNVRARAVTQLARTGDPRVLPDLVDALQDQSPAVREAAALALSEFHDPSALPALRQALRSHDEDEWVRLRMGQALAQLGDAEGLEVLLQLARNAEAKLARIESLSDLARLLGRTDLSATEDPEVFDAELEAIESWWNENGDHLHWEADSHLFRPAR